MRQRIERHRTQLPLKLARLEVSRAGLFSLRSCTEMQDVIHSNQGASMKRLALACSLAAAVAGVHAETFIDNARVRSAALMAMASPTWANLSRDDAATAAQRLTNGRVLSVEQSEAARRPVWRVKVVTAQGEVRVILMDAVSGQVL